MVRFYDKGSILDSEISSDDILPITDIDDNQSDKKITIGQLIEFLQNNSDSIASKDLSNTGMLSDAILEAPNGVIVATDSNTKITAKQGLKVLFANGKTSDGHFNSTEYSLSEDVSQNITTLPNDTYELFLNQDGSLVYIPLTQIYISKSQPTVSTQNAYWYDVVSNYWKLTQNTGSTWSNALINAIGQFTINSGVVSSVEPGVVSYISNPDAYTIRDLSNITNQGIDNIKSYISFSNLANTSLSNITSQGQDVIKNYSDKLPIGSIIWYTKNTAPTGYLICDGSAISRTTYADLFDVIGTTFGSGDGSTTFNIPNLIDRFVKGNRTLNQINTAIGSTGVDLVHSHEYVQGSITNAYTNGALGTHSHTITAPSITLLPCIKY